MHDEMKNPSGATTAAELSPEEKARRELLPEAARRALAEADERRLRTEKAKMAEEQGYTPTGPEPTRYGDWERKGIAYDF